MLEVSGLRAGYGRIEALHGIDLTVPEGAIVTLLGANGAGKTTTLMCISGCTPVRQGRIKLDGQDITNLPAPEIVRRGLVHVPEGRKIFPKLTVEENLEMGAYTRRDRDVPGDIKKVFELFPVLGERRRQLGGTLSGGEQQMLALGRALLSRPRLLILDEPSLGLAPLIVLKIFDALRDLNGRGVTLLLVEQNALMALKLASYGYVMETGSICLHGPASQLLADQGVKRAYLGDELGH